MAPARTISGDPPIQDTATSGGGGGGTRPWPPRYIWLKRISLGVVVVLVLLSLLRWWWGREADKRLNAEIARIKARGEPLFLEDFKAPPVADEENAAKALMDALAMWDETNLVVDERKYLADNAEALALVRKARDMPGCDWGIKLVSPGIDTLLPHLGSMRMLARKLVGVAETQLDIDDEAEAVETLHDTLVLATLVDQPPTTLISHLVSLSIRALAVDKARQLAPRLDNREAINRLTAALLDETAVLEDHRQAWLGERGLFQFDSSTAFVDGKLSLTLSGPPNKAERPLIYVFRPLVQLDAINCLRYMEPIVAAANNTNWHTLPAFKPPTVHWTRPLSRLLLPSLGAAYKTQFRGLAESRMSVIVLALRLYELDKGRRPAILDQLVPDYLPAIPRDPFHPDDAPIKYTGSLLYSIGPDGIDDGGQADQVRWADDDLVTKLDDDTVSEE